MKVEDIELKHSDECQNNLEENINQIVEEKKSEENLDSICEPLKEVVISIEIGENQHELQQQIETERVNSPQPPAHTEIAAESEKKVVKKELEINTSAEENYVKQHPEKEEHEAMEEE